MLVGCPLFAVIYTIAKDFINYCLEKRKLSTDTQTYVNLKTIEDGRDGYEYIEYTVSEINGKRNKKNSASKAKNSSLMSVLKKFLKKVMDSKQISKDKNDEK